MRQGEYVPSFGRPETEEADQLEDDGGSDGLGKLRVELIPVLDEVATAAAMEKIRAQVDQAVRDGYRDGFKRAIAEMDAEAEEAGGR